MPLARREYAINASNGRHWPLAIRAFVEECVAGAEGPRGVDYNTRWLGAVVAEAYRILLHGGIYLYPGDARPDYRRGRLRLLYEVNPLALLIEQAGGMATDGFGRILDLVPADIHERAPLIFGSPDKVERVMAIVCGERATGRTATVVRNARAVQVLNRKAWRMSVKHPIISVTGSSGAGTTTVRYTFERIFVREKIEAAWIEGDAFHRHDRAGMRRAMAGSRGDRQQPLQSFRAGSEPADRAGAGLRRIWSKRPRPNPPLRA